MVRARREAAERRPESLCRNLMGAWQKIAGREGAQTLTRHWGNHTNISPGPARSRHSGNSAVVGWRCWSGLAGGSSVHVVALQPCPALREREGQWLNVQPFGTCSGGNHCRSKQVFIQGSWPVCRRISLLWYPEDSKCETQRRGKSNTWSSTLLTERVTCC